MSSGSMSLNGKRSNPRGRVGGPAPASPCLGRGHTVQNPSPLLASKRSSIAVRYINNGRMDKPFYTGAHKLHLARYQLAMPSLPSPLKANENGALSLEKNVYFTIIENFTCSV